MGTVVLEIPHLIQVNLDGLLKIISRPFMTISFCALDKEKGKKNGNLCFFFQSARTLDQ